MKHYLENYGDMYVGIMPDLLKTDRFNNKAIFKSNIKATLKFKEKMNSTITFLMESKGGISNTIEKVLDKLEVKLNIINSTIDALNRAKFNFGDSVSDISVINLSECELSNMAFSIMDDGIILNSMNMVVIGGHK